MLSDGMIIYVVLVLGLLYSAFVVVFCNNIALRLGVVDHPGSQEHKAHARSTPLVGGLLAVPPAIAVLLVQGLQEDGSSPYTTAYLALAFATLMSLVIGFFDDRRHIPPLQRLIICSVIFCVALSIRSDFVVSYLDLRGIGVQLALGFLGLPFSVICILAFQNAVNMADGRNGLVAGITIIWLLTLLSYGWHPSTLAIASLLVGMFIALGANLSGRLFLGDAGTYGIGAFVGLVTIWIHRSNVGLHTTDVVIMFLVPVLDMARLFLFRVLTRRHPFSADQWHLHHYLDRSIGWNRGRKVYYTITAAPIILSRFEFTNSINVLILGVVIYVTLFAVLFIHCRLNIRNNLYYRNT